MKRDKAKAAKILEWMEKNTPSIGSRKPDILAGVDGQGAESKEFEYHLDLLIEAGYISRERSGTGSDYHQLTWAGHDLLEALRAFL